MRNSIRKAMAGSLALAIGWAWQAPLLAQADLPATTEDGLTKLESKRVDVLYWRPGASLAPYKRIALLDCQVSFRKDWQEDQNSERRGVERVTAEDMERIQTLLAEEFRKEFTRELQERGGYEIVDVVGEDVLVLRPAIVNLDVAAPDLPTASRTRSFVASPGQMTLYMELFDSATKSLIGRAIDNRQGMDTGGFQISNSVTNRAEADRILRAWATTLREALDDQWSGSR
jgi:hypothetical protein